MSSHVRRTCFRGVWWKNKKDCVRIKIICVSLHHENKGSNRVSGQCVSSRVSGRLRQQRVPAWRLAERVQRCPGGPRSHRGGGRRGRRSGRKPGGHAPSVHFCRSETDYRRQPVGPHGYDLDRERDMRLCRPHQPRQPAVGCERYPGGEAGPSRHAHTEAFRQRRRPRGRHGRSLATGSWRA